MFNAIKFYRGARWCYTHNLKIIAVIIQGLIFLIYNSYIPYECEIGEGTRFGYGGISVVIHARSRIGRNCVISQGVTIGGRSKKHDVPNIGDDVYMGAGSKIIGPVKVGNNVVIGANAVVIEDVPDHTVVAGIPARVIRQGVNMRDYI